MDSDLMMALRHAVIFVTDQGFAAPTMIAALQARQSVPRETADIRVIITDMPEPETEVIRHYLEPRGVYVDVMHTADHLAFDRGQFNRTHVPVSTLARFFMLDAIPQQYDRILYLDGDTWPSGDLPRLLAADLPHGCIAAAEDKNYFRRYEMGPVGRRTRAYLHGLGLHRDAGYFNAGVILAHADTWRALSAEAFSFFQAHTALCVYHDQSALNAVAGPRRVRLAPQWNFAGSYFDWGIRTVSPPQIIHFAGGEKPWMLPFHPFYKNYATSLAPLSALGLRVKQLPPEELGAQATRARWRRLRDRSFIHRTIFKQRTFDMLVRTSVIG